MLPVLGGEVVERQQDCRGRLGQDRHVGLDRTSARRLPGRSRRRSSRHPSWFRPSRCLAVRTLWLVFCRPFRQLVQDVARLVNPACVARGRLGRLGGSAFHEAERAVAERQLQRPISRPRRLTIEQKASLPGLLTFAMYSVGRWRSVHVLSLVRGLRRSPGVALLLFLHAGAEIDAVHPEIDVALGREVAPLPALRPSTSQTSFSRVDRARLESPGCGAPQ